MVVIALAVVVEIGAASFFEARIEERVRERIRDVTLVRADVDSFPVVTRLLVTGRIRRMTLELDRLVRQRVTFASVRLVVTGLKLDRAELLRRRKVELRDIDTGQLFVELTAENLSDLAGVPLEIRPGQVSLRVAGTTIAARPEIRGRTLRLAGRQVPPLTVALPEELASCTPDLELQLGRLLLSCPIQELPSIFNGS